MKQTRLYVDQDEILYRSNGNGANVQSGAAEKFALLMMRCWVRALTSEKGSSQIHEALNIWNKGFCSVGGMEASKSFDHFMSLLARKSIKRLQVGCPKCKEPNQDEQRILNILSSYQRGKADTGTATLKYWLEGHDSQLAEHHIILFVAALNRQDYRFRDNKRREVVTKGLKASPLTQDFMLSPEVFASKTIH